MSQWRLVNTKPQFLLLNVRVFCSERKKKKKKKDNVNENSKFNKTNNGYFVVIGWIFPMHA